MITSPALLDVPEELVTFLADLLAHERHARGTRAGTRALSCQNQAIFALVWFREDRQVALIGRGLGISQATSYRYLDEAIDVLAARTPGLHEALGRVQQEGWPHVILDGKVDETDRLAEKKQSKKGKTIDAWYSGMWERIVRDWMGPAGQIVAIRGFRMGRFNTVGRTTTVRGQVTAVDAGTGLVTLSLLSEDPDGVTGGPGEVDVRLPLA